LRLIAFVSAGACTPLIQMIGTLSFPSEADR
jgi:hypothetical protein